MFPYFLGSPMLRIMERSCGPIRCGGQDHAQTPGREEANWVLSFFRFTVYGIMRFAFVAQGEKGWGP